MINLLAWIAADTIKKQNPRTEPRNPQLTMEDGTANGPCAWCFQLGRRKTGIKFYQTPLTEKAASQTDIVHSQVTNTPAVDHTTKRWQSPEIPPKGLNFAPNQLLSSEHS